MGILYGLAAALMWGGGDFFINRLTALIGTSRSLLVIQVLSLLCWLIAGALLGFPAHSTAALWGLAVVCGVFHVAGLAFTYRAFEVGMLSLVSPIASSFAIVTAILALASGERPGTAAIGGAFLLVAGVAVVSRGSGKAEHASLRGVPEALASAVGFGVMFWLMDRVTPTLGMAWPLVVLKLMATGSALGATMVARRKERLPTRPSVTSVVALGLAVAVTDSLAWAAFILGTRTSYTSVVTALASLFSAVTVVMAAVLLHERLSRSQLAGVAIVLAGILLVSL